MQPKIYVHRANSRMQLELAKENGWGVEIDIRSHLGRLYACHDPIDKFYLDTNSCFSLQEALKFCLDESLPVVLDIKESNIAAHVRLEMHEAGYIDEMRVEGAFPNIYATDIMAFDQIAFEGMGVRTLSRLSPYELPIGSKFFGCWHDYVFNHLEMPCCGVRPHSFLVSPELHGGELEAEFIKAARKRGYEGVCTDSPKLWTDSAL